MSCSQFEEIISGVPQESILSPLLFNIYIGDLFFETGDLDIASDADDNTPFIRSSELSEVLSKLKINISKRTLKKITSKSRS